MKNGEFNTFDEMYPNMIPYLSHIILYETLSLLHAMPFYFADIMAEK